MAVYKGTTGIAAAYLGDTAIANIYLGSTQVWTAAQPVAFAAGDSNGSGAYIGQDATITFTIAVQAGDYVIIAHQAAVTATWTVQWDTTGVNQTAYGVENMTFIASKGHANDDANLWFARLGTQLLCRHKMAHQNRLK